MSFLDGKLVLVFTDTARSRRLSCDYKRKDELGARSLGLSFI